MTGTTVISLELAIVTALRQVGELPQVHRRQQSAVCESCQEYSILFLIIQAILKRLQGLVTSKYLGSLYMKTRSY